MRGLAGWRRRYWMMIRWYWWIINVGECKCPLVHKYQYWYYDLDNIYWYINVGSCNFQIYPEMSIPTGYISFPIFRLDHCRRQPRGWKKKVPSWKIVFLVGSGNRFLMTPDDFWWFRMTSDDFGWLLMISDDFCIKRLQGCKFLVSTRLPKHQSKGPWLQKVSQTPAGK